jgi:hypothetical protein
MIIKYVIQGQYQLVDNHGESGESDFGESFTVHIGVRYSST